MSCPIHDKDKLKHLVLDAIKHQITMAAAESNVDDTPPPDILAIASALNNGHVSVYVHALTIQ